MRLPEFQVSDEMLHMCGPFQLGCLHCRLSNSAKNELLWAEIEQKTSELRQHIHLDQINKIPAIMKTRETYKILGKDPSRYRPSAEALSRRAIQGKALYQLNCVVDIINLLSLESGYSIGGYDAEKISGTIVLKRGSNIDVFQAIGRGELNIENLPVLYDDMGPIGSPTSDSVRSSISEDTRKVLIVFFDFTSNEQLREWTERAVDLLVKYTGAEQVEKEILRFTPGS